MFVFVAMGPGSTVYRCSCFFCFVFLIKKKRNFQFVYCSRQRLHHVCVAVLLWKCIWFYLVEICRGIEGSHMYE